MVSDAPGWCGTMPELSSYRPSLGAGSPGPRRRNLPAPACRSNASPALGDPATGSASFPNPALVTAYLSIGACTEWLTARADTGMEIADASDPREPSDPCAGDLHHGSFMRSCPDRGVAGRVRVIPPRRQVGSVRVDGAERARGRRSCRYAAYRCGPLSWIFFCSAPVPGSRVVPLGLTPGNWLGAVT